ncbi:hypothetical protein H0B56_19785 [Haloechinothrix sp. YIM 98757]|uniref:Excreted virulence factor EspC, type VII ESX diderm n=1 Tax=Haloechinothrix aidingensis TaxID=2752311 RepID=A0A838AEW8_9PSEU|nr:hypothetical protein [Haloechinothrix aidingensis]MBA0127793.1 hypothetical protein [Haloechinothrix aidingensis]
MSDGFYIESDVVSRAADTLTAASDQLGGVAHTAPSLPDVGEGSGPVAEILRKLMTEADRLVTETSAAGEAVRNTASKYLDVDERSAESMHVAGGLE